MSIVTVPGGNGVTIAIPFTSSDNATAAMDLLNNLYYAPVQQQHVAYASSGIAFDGAIPGDQNLLIDNVAGQVQVPLGYQNLVADYKSSALAPYPINSFVAAGVMDGAIIDCELSVLNYTAGTGLTTVVAGGNFTMNTRAIGGGSGVLLLDGFGNENVNLASGNWSVISGTGAGNLALGAGNDTIFAEGIDTIRGGVGPSTVTLDHGQDVFYGGAGTATVVDHGTQDTVVAGAGRETVFAQGTGLLVQGAGAEMLFVDASGGNELFADGSGVVAFGGAHGSAYQTANNYFYFTSGGGSDTIYAPVATLGPIVFGSANGRVQINAATGGSFVVAGAGPETIDAGASTGGVTFFSGTGDDDLIGGRGSNFYGASTGDSTMSGGLGNVYQFIDGHEGGINTITDFTPYDSLFITNFGLGPNDGIVTEQVINGVLNMTLGDGTLIKFDNISNVSQLDGKIFHI